MTRTWFTEGAIGLDVSGREAVATLVTSSTLTGPVRHDIRQIESVSQPDGCSDDELIRTVLERFPAEYPVICVSRGVVSHMIQPGPGRSSDSAPAGGTSEKNDSTSIPADPADTLKPIRDAGGDILRNRSGLITADMGVMRRRIASINALPKRLPSCPGGVSEIDAIAAVTALTNDGLRLIVTADSSRHLWIAADGLCVLACRSGIPESPSGFAAEAAEAVRRLFPDRTPARIRELPEAARATGAAICWLRTGAACLLQPAGEPGLTQAAAFAVTGVTRRNALLVRSAVLVFLLSFLGIGIRALVAQRTANDQLAHRVDESAAVSGPAGRIPGLAVIPSGIEGFNTHRYLADVAETAASSGVRLNDIRVEINRMDIQGFGDDMSGIDAFSRSLTGRLQAHGASVQPPVTSRDSAGRLQFRVTASWGDAR